MYKLTNQTTGSSHGFDSYDQLLAELDKLNTICRAEELTMEIKLVQVDHDTGEILDNLQISLPSTHHVDNLIIGFGRKKPKKDKRQVLPNPFSKRQPSPRTATKPLQEPELVKEQVEPAREEHILAEDLPPSPPVNAQLVEQVAPLPAPKPRGRGLRIALVALNALVLTGLAGLSVVQSMHLERLTNRLEQVEQTAGNHIDHKLNVFGRYFLTSYYSGTAGQDLVTFVKGDLNQQVKSQANTLVSAILEDVTQKKDGSYQVSFILAVKDKDRSKHVRLTFGVEDAPGTAYHFQVTQAPQETPYPN